MNSKEQRSAEQVRRLLAALGCSPARIEPQLPPRPDVLVEVCARRIAIETTDYHGDETAKAGSALRKREEQDATAGRIRTYPVPIDPLPGVIRRITEKATKRYELSGADELWLAIFAGVPQPGAVASTFLLAISLNCHALSEQTASLLEKSQFSRCYLFCELTEKGPTLCSWTKGSQWREIKISRGQTDSTPAS